MTKVKKGETPIEGWDGIFADPEVGRILKLKGKIADANKSSIEELATIKSLNPSDKYNTGYFYNNKVITQFPELQYCTGLTSLLGVFRGCSSLTTVGDIPEGVTDLNSTFNGCSSLTTAPVIPEGVTGMYATFYGCSNLLEAPIIPEGVTDLRSTFEGCSNLTTALNIPEGVPDLSWTFLNCTSLTTAPVLPSSVTNLYETFRGCTSLTKAPIIPSSVTDLRYTFSNCSSIDGIYIINAVTPPSYYSSLSNVQAIYVPDASVDAYKAKSGWSGFSSKIYPMSTKP